MTYELGRLGASKSSCSSSAVQSPSPCTEVALARLSTSEPQEPVKKTRGQKAIGLEDEYRMPSFKCVFSSPLALWEGQGEDKPMKQTITTFALSAMLFALLLKRLLLVDRVPQGDLENVFKSQGTTPHRTHRLATGDGIGCERRYPFDSESGAWCRSGACDAQQRIARGRRWPGSGSYVDGCR